LATCLSIFDCLGSCRDRQIVFGLDLLTFHLLDDRVLYASQIDPGLFLGHFLNPTCGSFRGFVPGFLFWAALDDLCFYFLWPDRGFDLVAVIFVGHLLVFEKNLQENGRFSAQVLVSQEIVHGVFLEFLYAQFSLFVPFLT